MYIQLPTWLTHLLLSLLLVLIFSSAVTLVVVRFENRQLFTELQKLEQQHDQLQIEWQQLQVEHSVWAKPERIEKLAIQKLHMHVPTPKDIILVQP